MVSVPTCVKAEIGERGSEKTDYRNPGAGEKMKMRGGSTTLSFSQNFTTGQIFNSF
jgi:hypothetical protein